MKNLLRKKKAFLSTLCPRKKHPWPGLVCLEPTSTWDVEGHQVIMTRLNPRHLALLIAAGRFLLRERHGRTQIPHLSAVFNYLCMYVCMYGWMDGWMDGWMYVSICIYIYIHLLIYVMYMKFYHIPVWVDSCCLYTPYIQPTFHELKKKKRTCFVPSTAPVHSWDL